MNSPQENSSTTSSPTNPSAPAPYDGGPFSNLRIVGIFLLGISVGISIMFFYMRVRNPDPLAELKRSQDVILSPIETP